MHFLRFAFAVFFMLTLAATRANPQNGFNGATTSSSGSTDGTGTTAQQGWRNALKCKACGLLAGWLLSEVAAGTPIEEYLDQKCGTTFLVARLANYWSPVSFRSSSTSTEKRLTSCAKQHFMFVSKNVSMSLHYSTVCYSQTEMLNNAHLSFIMMIHIKEFVV